MKIVFNWNPLRQAQTKRFTEAEEADLILRYQEGDRRAGDTLVKAHIGAICNVASQYSGFGEHDELVQWAMYGFTMSMQKYDVRMRKARFGTYAVFGMIQYIKKYINRYRHAIIYINTGSAQRASDGMARASSHIRAKYGGKLSDAEVEEEVCKFLSITQEELERAKLHHAGEHYFSQMFSTTDEENEHNELSMESVLIDEESSAEDKLIEAYRQSVIRKVVRTALTKQHERARSIMVRRYMVDEVESIALIAEDLGVSKQAIAQVIHRTQGKMMKSVKSQLATLKEEI